MGKEVEAPGPLALCCCFYPLNSERAMWLEEQLHPSLTRFILPGIPEKQGLRWPQSPRLTFWTQSRVKGRDKDVQGLKPFPRCSLSNELGAGEPPSLPFISFLQR